MSWCPWKEFFKYDPHFELFFIFYHKLVTYLALIKGDVYNDQKTLGNIIAITQDIFFNLDNEKMKIITK